MSLDYLNNSVYVFVVLMSYFLSLYTQQKYFFSF